MQSVPQDLLKEYVQSQHFTSTTEIMEAMKEMFRDVIQTVMEVEMDEELGRERCERSDKPEGAPRNYRKPSFTNDDSLRRMLYLASQRIVKHWHARCQNWDLVLSQLEIMFADRAIG